MIFTLITNHYGIKCVSNILQIEICNVTLKVIPYIMEHWYDM